MIYHYNYSCISTICSLSSLQGILKEETDKFKEELCPNCNLPMKRMGQKSAAYMGSKEGQYQKMQKHLHDKAKAFDKDPETIKLKKKREKEEISSLRMKKK